MEKEKLLHTNNKTKKKYDTTSILSKTDTQRFYASDLFIGGKIMEISATAASDGSSSAAA